MVITRGKAGLWEVEKGKGGINGDRKTLDRTMNTQYTGDALQNWTLGSYIILLTNATPIH